jgi:phosphorylcholine metabolism protein LicD
VNVYKGIRMSGDIKLEGKIAEIAEKMLLKICEILEKEKIPYVLEGGTLLGIVREKRLLPWDNDLDITITDDYLEKLLKAKKYMWLAGFRTRVRFHNRDIGPFKKGQVRLIKVSTRKFFFIKGIKLLDIFIKTKESGQYFWVVGVKNPVLKSAEARYYEKFATVGFNNAKLSIPYDFDDYLSYRYGDWKKPVKEWNFKKDDNAIVKKGN